MTLTAQNHQPRPSGSPGWHWWYSVKVGTATGKPVTAEVHLRLLSNGTPVEEVGTLNLRKGHDDWRAAIGGEANVLDSAPRGQKLVFQAAVAADGVTVKRNWPIVVR